MDKVKITKEQEKALRHWKINENELYHFIDHEVGKRTDELKALYDFTPEQFSLLLNGWYEVEEEFKVGDWVVVTESFLHKGGVSRVTSFSETSQSFTTDGHVNAVGSKIREIFRKATPDEIAKEKERRKWAKIGREVGEYKIGDIVRIKNAIAVIKNKESDFVYVSNSGMRYFLEEVVLITPVEQRFDLKEDE